jgi:hypothetical protein
LRQATAAIPGRLPRSWTADPARCAAAGLPGKTAFATKPARARRMIGRTLDAGTPAAWVTGDEVYGADPGLRADLERRQIGYVLAVAASCQVSTAAGLCQARQIAARLPRRAWQRYSAGEGAKGHRSCDWAWLAIDPARPGHRWLLIRRSRRSGELAFYRCYRPLPRFPARPGQDRRDQVATEENFQAGKGLTGLDEHQVRRWDSWYRWTTLAMLALAFLTITAATEHASSRPDPADPQRDRRAVQHADHRPGERRPAPAAMVRLAAPPPVPRQNLPLPAASSRGTMIITVSGPCTRHSSPPGI